LIVIPAPGIRNIHIDITNPGSVGQNRAAYNERSRKSAKQSWQPANDRYASYFPKTRLTISRMHKLMQSFLRG